MVINLSEVMSIRDKVEHIEAPLALESFKLNGMEYAVAQKDVVSFDFISKKEKAVAFEAHTKLSLLIPCGRCLDDVEVPFDISISKNLDFKETDADRIKELDEVNYIDGYNLDVDLLIFDEILLDFPMNVLCREDCKGICKECGKNLNKESCDCEQSVGDPRMSVIQDIFKNFKEV